MRVRVRAKVTMCLRGHDLEHELRVAVAVGGAAAHDQLVVGGAVDGRVDQQPQRRPRAAPPPERAEDGRVAARRTLWRGFG